MVEVVAALIWEKDKFLICQRPANKARPLLWEFVGGKVEVGETRPQALIRECQEELAGTQFRIYFLCHKLLRCKTANYSALKPQIVPVRLVFMTFRLYLIYEVVER
ncbi:MAG: NUDIX domain-containing protein [Clostridia bacterium]|nr:NUDIX domain-containing protein [Clostridia bacterium]